MSHNDCAAAECRTESRIDTALQRLAEQGHHYGVATAQTGWTTTATPPVMRPDIKLIFHYLLYHSYSMISVDVLHMPLRSSAARVSLARPPTH